MSSYADPRRLSAMSTGDIELAFHDGRSIKAHSAKLASLGGILHNLIEDLIEAHDVGSKQRRAEPASSSDETDDLISIMVGSAPCRYSCIMAITYILHDQSPSCMTNQLLGLLCISQSKCTSLYQYNPSIPLVHPIPFTLIIMQ